MSQNDGSIANSQPGDDEVSPTIEAPLAQSTGSEYSTNRKDKRPSDETANSSADTRQDSGMQSESSSTQASMSAATTLQEQERSWNDGEEEDDSRPGSRKSSIASVTFRQPRNQSLPQGHQRKTDAERLRASSPVPVKFQRHVGFDNLPVGEATKFNTSAFTLNFRHRGYQTNRRSRTFMAGFDDHVYSNYALSWLLENLVDDGDEVVCVRVVENPTRSGDKGYREEAKRMMQTIQDTNRLNKAISIVLEYSMGKLHATFQQLIQMYQPSMLIVGTRGRSLGGIQGLVNTRNSFSKYCLQYSPVPVVVVRPDDKRQKKKDKRREDPSRQSYVAMLMSNKGKHEADSETSSMYDLDNKLSPDEEAHRVAAAIGLPASFDPTIKPYTGTLGGHRGSTSSAVSATTAASGTDRLSPRRRTSSPPPVLANDSGEEESDEEEEFEVVSGQQAQNEHKARLHMMEIGEAAALRTFGTAAVDDEDEDEDEERDEDYKKREDAKRREQAKKQEKAD